MKLKDGTAPALGCHRCHHTETIARYLPKAEGEASAGRGVQGTHLSRTRTSP
jgi:hypothetical protein